MGGHPPVLTRSCVRGPSIAPTSRPGWRTGHGSSRFCRSGRPGQLRLHVRHDGPRPRGRPARFGAQISPSAREQRVRLQERLVELDYVRPGLETVVETISQPRCRLFNEANVPLYGSLSRLDTEWSKVNGAMTVDWEGEERTPAQLLPFLESTRSRRPRARVPPAPQPYIQQRACWPASSIACTTFASGSRETRASTTSATTRTGEKNRFDYTPEDCMRFHEAVEDAVLPAVARLSERQRRQMGLDTLRPWETADPKGRPPLHPFDAISVLIDRAGASSPTSIPTSRATSDGWRTRAARPRQPQGQGPGGYCRRSRSGRCRSSS